MQLAGLEETINDFGLKRKGMSVLDTGDGEAELQLLYGKLISPFFDFQAGDKI